jgi:hypothetical protein
MVSLGLVSVTAHARVNTSTEEIARRPQLIDQSHQQAVSAGVITAGEAKERTAAILAAIEDGTFLHTTLFWMTVGTKP